jgi:integrase
VQPAYVALLATGLRVGEYLACTAEHLLPLTFGLRVPGTKTKESRNTVYVDTAMWPWITAAVPAPVKYRWLRLHWRAACLGTGAAHLVNGRYVGPRIHDLRHLFAQLATDAGESEARVQVALRHASPDMTRRYSKQRAKKDVAVAVGRALKRA